MTNDTTQTPICDHERTEVRKRQQSNGVWVAVRQCLRCGCNRGSVKKDSVAFYRLPAWDQPLHDRWSEAMRRFWAQRQQQYVDERERQDSEWRARYNAHLLSPKWQRLRQLVFLRSGGLCEGCRLRPARQVHHLTYARMGDEMLFDLVAICGPCHDRIHGLDTGDEE